MVAFEVSTYPTANKYILLCVLMITSYLTEPRVMSANIYVRRINCKWNKVIQLKDNFSSLLILKTVIISGILKIKPYKCVFKMNFTWNVGRTND